MRKLLVLLAFVLVSCSPVESTARVVTEERGEFLISQNGAPRGSYILIRYNSSGPNQGQTILVDLVFNDEEVCTWDLGNTQPWDRGEDLLYFTTENCEIEQRNTVIWHVDYPGGINYGQIVFDSKIIQQIPVWTLTGTNYTMLD